MKVRSSALALKRAIEEVATVELDTRLRGRDTQHASTGWFVNLRCLGKAGPWGIEHPVVIVAFAKVQLLIVSFNVFSDACRVAEIKWRRSYRLQFAGRNQG